ncbi:MAG: NAD(P)-dependent glycerol-3-phosphate dehydrogenase [Candidatus Omnitrophica bacterium]|nr:NAD(P)-dependent glycerol-3-phosphate dehydrogenase [Candidatus Omnitrophota bacterium]
MRITVLGCGAWGTALARMLYGDGHEITLWGNLPEQLAELRMGRNQACLPGIELPRDWSVVEELDKAVQRPQVIIVAVPSRAVRQVTSGLTRFRGIIISVAKGIEYDSGLTMSGVLRSTAPSAQIAALSGPTFALEVAREIPTAIVAASEDAATAEAVQTLFHRPKFRVYTNPDILGVELGGALKNVIAIAAGTSDGLGFGDNTKAALITRAIVEIRRLGVACGARADTFAGLSGLGDLTVTCFSRLSRNRALGERLGRGEELAAVLPTLTSVAEGYPTACSAYQLARRLEVITPIIDEVYAMLYQGKKAGQAVHDLLNRDSKGEVAEFLQPCPNTARMN